MSVFENPWYADMIERFSPDADDDNGSAARAILAGLCILAQSVDGVAARIVELTDAIERTAP